MSRSLKITAIILALTAIVGVSLFVKNNPLDKIHAAVELNYPEVEHISSDQFAVFDSSELVIFDVREPDEFKVSHLPNAILVSPDADPEEFIEDYGEQIKGKRLVFYCSVGRRSSELINRLQTNVESADEFALAGASYNLIGGVFAWANAERELETVDGGLTEKVHPYNKFWGKLIDDSNKRQY